jgi:tripartite-type tricarboxylate transporter receptor subunit TctC
VNAPSTPRPASLSRRKLLACAAAAPLLSGSALAQTDWPVRPVRLIVPFSPGGAADTSARAMGQRIAEMIGQPLTVENRTGGNAVVAAGALLQAPRDGYSFIWDAANQLTNPVLIRDLQFDYRSAFVPITLAVRAPQALLVRQDFPARTLDEFLEIARGKPGTFSCGTPPSGAMGHLAAALLQQRAGIKLIHTPYKGGADAARDLMGGQIDSALITTATAHGALGRARMLAVTSGSRSTAYPDIPTIAERGFAGYDMDDWFGLFAASGTPEAPMKRMQAAIAKVARDPAFGNAMAPLGMVPVGNGSQEFAGWLAQQREVLQKLVRDANISLG